LPWHQCRIALIGDAAHSLSPQLTSGGGMAIEDAIVLAQELDRATNVESALVAYETRREPRVRPILETSLGICHIEQNPSVEGHEGAMQLLRKGLQLLAEPI
jgi:2-polyprenyl-6-methoxyphenol hydroxylase-like FAD-dependent oxidoreductase